MASEKITAIIDEIKGLSILELKELIDTYCEEFGVSAVAAAPAAAAGAAPADEAAFLAALAPVFSQSLDEALRAAHKRAEVS